MFFLRESAGRRVAACAGFASKDVCVPQSTAIRDIRAIRGKKPVKTISDGRTSKWRKIFSLIEALLTKKEKKAMKKILAMSIITISTFMFVHPVAAVARPHPQPNCRRICHAELERCLRRGGKDCRERFEHCVRRCTQ